MSFTETRLVNPTQLTTSASSALYTVPTGKSVIVKQLVVTNTTSTSATFTFYINGSTAEKALFSSTSVAGNDTVVINLSQVLNSAETINALASANTTLNLTVSGVVNDGPLNPLSIYIADNAITTPKIADASVTTAKIAAGAVVTEDIANNAVTQGKLSTDIPLSGFRNRIINGDFSIWQRGTASIAAQLNAYCADRWLASQFNANSARDVSRQSFSLGELTDHTSFYLRHNVTVSGNSNSYCRLEQRIEDVRSCGGQQISISFWAKSQTNGMKVAVGLAQNFGTGGSPSSEVVVYGNTFSLTTTWSRYTLIMSVPSISGKTIGSNANDYLSLILWQNAGSAYDSQTGSLGLQTGFVDFWGVQVEENTQPTPFEQRPIGVELALCQRYYHRLNYTQFIGETIATFQTYSSTGAFGAMPNHPVTMRGSSPTVGFSSRGHFFCTNNNAGGAIAWGTGSLFANTQSIMCTGINMTTTFFSAGNATVFATGSTSAWIDVSSEL